MIWPTDILSMESWILILLLLSLGKYYLYRKWKVLEEWNIPHDPPSIFNLGHLLIFYLWKPFVYDLECKKKFGPVWGYYIFTEPRIEIHDVEILKKILITDFSNFPNRTKRGISIGGDEMENGLLLVKEDRWKRIRSSISPGFSSAKLRQMVKIFSWCVGNTLKVLQSNVEKCDGQFAPKDVFSRLSMDVICSTAFSVDVNSQDATKEEPTISKHAKAHFNFGLAAMVSYITSYLPIIMRVNSWRRNRMEHVKYFRELCKRMVHQRKSDSNGDLENRVDLMQVMLAAKISESELKSGVQHGLTPTEITANAITMLLAGYETTGTAMTYLAYNLATHPEIQKKLQAEIDEVFHENEEPDFDAIMRLKFLNMCINETLRLYCPVTRTHRIAKNTVTINGVTGNGCLFIVAIPINAMCHDPDLLDDPMEFRPERFEDESVIGLTIPKGCVVSIPIYAMCHDPDLWKNPMDFQPERMRNVSEIDSMVFLPFGAGPRNCIGSKFAILEMKLAFSKILRHYSFEPTSETPEPPLELAFGITTRPKHILKLRVVSKQAFN